MVTCLVLTFVLAIVLAWAVASRRTEHMPIAVLLSLGLASSVAEQVWDLAVLAPLRSSLGLAAPWTGWARAAGSVEDALALVWPTALVGAALVVFGRRRVWLAVGGWAVAVAFFVVAHPNSADGNLESAMAVVQVVAALAAAVLWTSWSRTRGRKATSVHYAMTAVVVAQLVALLGAWHVGPFKDWIGTQSLYLVMLAVLVLMQGYAILERLRACEAALDVAGKGVLRSNLFAERAVELATRAEEKSHAALNVAEGARR